MNTVITHFVAEQYDATFPTGNLLAFRDWLAQQIESIPAEYRDVAKIDIGTDSSYDTCYATLEIKYQRPETPEETAARERRDADRRREREAADRAQYEALRRKFGG